MIIEIPEIKAGGARFGLEREDTPLRKMSGGEVFIQSRVALWVFAFSVIPQREDDARLWTAALARLSRFGNYFLAGPPAYNGAAYLVGRYVEDVTLELDDEEGLELSSGELLALSAQWSSGGPLLVDGSGQLGRNLLLKGADNAVTVLRAGEYFQVGNELKIVTEDAVSDGSGGVRVWFEPALRAAPANEQYVEIATPKARFRLSSPVGDWQIRPTPLWSISIDAIETHA
jgi:hypothetical protein